MKVAITQPTCLPWLGYFELIAKVDAFVFLDTVQFEKQSWQSRNKIRSTNGQIIWLSVPVVRSHMESSIKDIEIATTAKKAFRKQEKTVYQALSKAPYLNELASLISDHFSPKHSLNNLADLNICFIKETAKAMGLTHLDFYRASDLNATGTREELLINICSELGANYYYSNAGSKCYLEAARSIFRKAQIHLDYQNWKHPVYPQLCEPFESHLSCLDAIASVGLDQCRKYIQS